ncbi:voltage-dependent T-type calcium channel subunit alpha-1G [Culex quinquefasciatus]|uniref:Voltage-dependent T-type calcium channel subunit alpha-1G n=1 Tax=Culex quinquefasciatus TaxID=7176 RepID=B0XGN0_CULQU|nr:voltage-dependent T-type calcium channel subunit alpha-1G [Culex quinquefasciatus]|eukprot:XP_001868802.1 voltage-dependent T-type calcium channel subunit alpha-1G [Culex quinquefasciatus]
MYYVQDAHSFWDWIYFVLLIVNQAASNSLNPPTAGRRKSSVMFNECGVLQTPPTIPEPASDKNVYCLEKMTQTSDGGIWQVSLPQSIHAMTSALNDCSDICLTDAMTCQELLAFSVAFSAALPTGHTTLESFYSTLTRNRTEEINNKNKDIKQTPQSAQKYKSDVMNKSVASDAKGMTQTIASNINNINNEEFSCCYELYQNAASMNDRHKDHSKPYLCLTRSYRLIKRSLHYVRVIIKKIVDHKYFQQGILLAILINTLSMGIEYHDQPEELTAIVETSNIVFSVIFAFEMVLKIVAEGPFGILGMYLFGGKFCKFVDESGQERECTCPEIVSKHPLCECDRKHFNNFLWATVTVFQRHERREREQRELVKAKLNAEAAAQEQGSEIFDDPKSFSESTTSDSYNETKGKWFSAEELRKNKCDILKLSNLQFIEPPIITTTAATPLDSPTTTHGSSRGFKDWDNLDFEQLEKHNSALLKPPPVLGSLKALDDRSYFEGTPILNEIRRNSEKSSSNACEARLSGSRLHLSNQTDSNQKRKSSLKNRKITKEEEILNNGKQVPCVRGQTLRELRKNDSLYQKSYVIQNDTQRDKNQSSRRSSIRRSSSVKIDSGPGSIASNISAASYSKYKYNDKNKYYIDRKSSLRLCDIKSPNNARRMSAIEQSFQKQSRISTRNLEISKIHEELTKNKINNTTSTASTLAPVSDSLNVVATGMFYGPDAYFTSGWNIMDGALPIVNFNEWRLLYFIAFILLVGFFVLNMFVGVVVENFHRCREEQEKEEKIRRAAKRALQMEKKRRRMHEPPYYTNYSPLRLFVHNVVTSKYFDLAIAAVIGLNVVTMAMEYYMMPLALEYALKIFNYFFTAVFILEAIMKLVALGLKIYMKDKWNQLDVAIVILSIVGIVLEELETNIIPINPTIIRVMRVLRIARVLKLLKMAKGIRALLDTVMQALPQHLEESHKQQEDEQEIETELEREFEREQEFEEEQALCMQLNDDQKQLQKRPLTKVSSLPSNFTYSTPIMDKKSNIQRRQTIQYFNHNLGVSICNSYTNSNSYDETAENNISNDDDESPSSTNNTSNDKNANNKIHIDKSLFNKNLEKRASVDGCKKQNKNIDHFINQDKTTANNWVESSNQQPTSDFESSFKLSCPTIVSANKSTSKKYRQLSLDCELKSNFIQDMTANNGSHNADTNSSQSVIPTNKSFLSVPKLQPKSRSGSTKQLFKQVALDEDNETNENSLLLPTLSNSAALDHSFNLLNVQNENVDINGIVKKSESCEILRIISERRKV